MVAFWSEGQVNCYSSLGCLRCLRFFLRCLALHLLRFVFGMGPGVPAVPAVGLDGSEVSDNWIKAWYRTRGSTKQSRLLQGLSTWLRTSTWERKHRRPPQNGMVWKLEEIESELCLLHESIVAIDVGAGLVPYDIPNLFLLAIVRSWMVWCGGGRGRGWDAA